MFRASITILNHSLKVVRGRNVRKFHQSVRCDQVFRWVDHNVGIESASTPPASWYTSQKFYEFVEAKHTFRGWVLVGSADQLKKDGDYLATTIANEPIIVIKSNGKLKAYYNVCRHHAAQLCDDGTGSLPTGRIRCPYHGWEYNFDGRLTKAMKMTGCKNFSPKDYGLHNLAVEVVGPFLYVNMSRPLPITSTPEATNNLPPTIEDDQPDSKQIFNMLHASGIEQLVHVKSKVYHLKCNWKVFIDNYLDGGYHVPVAHPELSKNLDLSKYTRQGFDNFYLQSCPPSPSADNRLNINKENNSQETVQNHQDALYIYQYPNICMNRYGPWLDTNVVFPLSANECEVHFNWWLDSKLATNQEFICNSLEASEQVQNEDIWLCERVQKGLQSVGYGVGRYSPMLEGGEYLFHQLLYQDYKKSSLYIA